MDRVKDGGEGWRNWLQQELADLEIQWLDPCNKPIKMGIEDAESRRQRRIKKMAGDFEFVHQEMSPIRRVDLRMVHICDWMPVNIDMEVHACGTYEEMFLGNREMKPVLAHIEQGIKYAPDWLMDALPLEHIFDSWSDLVRYVRYIAHYPDIDDLGRWMFFDWMGTP
jgi:hypothetical protein